MKVKTSFGKFAELWDAKVGEDGSNIEAIKLQIPIFFDMLGNLKGKRVYEIACGNGFLSRQLVKKGVKEVFASDVAPALIEIAKTKYESKDIQYMVREGTDMKGLPKNNFDAVVINQGIFYIENLDALFKGIAGILKPGGVVVYNILHPLFPVFRKAIGEDTSMGEPIDIIELSKKYPKDYTKRVEKIWKVNGEAKTVHYLTYKRPIQTYINAAAKYGLLVSQIAEPSSTTKLKGKKKSSPIPSSMIIKALKITN